jgi:hypothetical protein
MTLRGGSTCVFDVLVSLLRWLLAEVVRQNGDAVLEEKHCKCVVHVAWRGVVLLVAVYEGPDIHISGCPCRGRGNVS